MLCEGDKFVKINGKWHIERHSTIEERKKALKDFIKNNPFKIINLSEMEDNE